MARILDGTGRINVGQGAVMTVQGLGASLSPAIGGWIAQEIGYGAMFLILGSFALGSVALWLGFARGAASPPARGPMPTPANARDSNRTGGGAVTPETQRRHLGHRRHSRPSASSRVPGICRNSSGRWPARRSLVLFHLLPWPDALAAAGKGTDVYFFLVGMMLLAEVARQEGLFDWLAAQAVRLRAARRNGCS